MFDKIVSSYADLGKPTIFEDVSFDFNRFQRKNILVIPHLAIDSFVHTAYVLIIWNDFFFHLKIMS